MSEGLVWEPRAFALADSGPSHNSNPDPPISCVGFQSRVEKRLPYRFFRGQQRQERQAQVESAKLFEALEKCAICKNRFDHPAIVTPGLVAPLIEAGASIDG